MDRSKIVVDQIVQEANSTSITRFGDVISDSQRQIIHVVIYVFLCGLISLFGMIANVINMIIFYRQGLNTTINITFFSLAVSDLCSLIFQQIFNIFMNPLFENSSLPVVALEIYYSLAGVPRETFSRITCLITVYVAAERCLCIAFPLHVKQMITPRRTTIAMIAIYSLTVVSVFPLYCTTYIDWKFYPDKNKTLLGVSFTSNRDHVDGIVLVIQAIIGILSFLAVVVFTIILIKILSQKNTWRKTASLDHDQNESMSNRDRKTIKTVVLIACILIVCYTPSAVLFFTTFAVPEFNVTGRYAGLFTAAWSFGFLFETVNSSVNIFLYFIMSTKYRSTFQELFSRFGRSGTITRGIRMTQNMQTVKV